MNTFGKEFRITSFGESHGACVGVVIDGCPAGLKLKKEEIQKELDKRKPGASGIASPRKEEDRVEILSGVFEGFTTGAPICLLVWNKDADSSSYKRIRGLLRPSHADFTNLIKYGGFNDYRGGGRASGRLTVSFVLAGAVAKELLKRLKIRIFAHIVELGGIKAEKKGINSIRRNVYKNPARCADLKAAEKMRRAVIRARKEGDSLGGIIEGLVLNLPVGLGEPIFDNLDGQISKALFAIPGVKGVEFGAGFSAAKMRGSENNDLFFLKKGRVLTKTNNAGGVLGGISSSMPLVVRVSVKPTPSISKPQLTLNVRKMRMENLKISGRHDACIAPRAVPIIEAMLAVTICDFALRAQLLPRVIRHR